jgi:hypothetical protein
LLNHTGGPFLPAELAPFFALTGKDVGELYVTIAPEPKGRSLSRYQSERKSRFADQEVHYHNQYSRRTVKSNDRTAYLRG